MRKVAIWGVVLIGVALILSTGGIEAEKAPKVVQVTGTVDVGNFPATQNVAGSVAVSNLPAVQSVTGTVDVGNLPLDAEGKVMVTSESAGRRTLFIKIIDGLTFFGDGQIASYPIDGWKKYTAYVRSVSLLDPPPELIGLDPRNSYSFSSLVGGDDVLIFNGSTTSVFFSVGEVATQIVTADVIGPELVLTVRGISHDNLRSIPAPLGSASFEIWLYLTN